MSRSGVNAAYWSCRCHRRCDEGIRERFQRCEKKKKRRRHQLMPPTMMMNVQRASHCCVVKIKKDGYRESCLFCCGGVISLVLVYKKEDVRLTLGADACADEDRLHSTVRLVVLSIHRQRKTKLRRRRDGRLVLRITLND